MKKIYGYGINDSKVCVTSPIVQKFYSTWSNMLERAYSKKYKERYPTKKNTTVCDEWLYFSVFDKWMKEQQWENNLLELNLITPGAKVFSPENCCFVSNKVKLMILEKKSGQGKYPAGVTLQNHTGKYRSSINKDSKSVYLGSFNTVEEAYKIYIQEKINLVIELAKAQNDERVLNGLLMYAHKLRMNAKNYKYEPVDEFDSWWDTVDLALVAKNESNNEDIIKKIAHECYLHFSNSRK